MLISSSANVLPANMLAASAIPGLLCAFAFAPDGTPYPLSDSEAPEALTREGGWIWLHFSLNDARARDWIARFDHLPMVARDLFTEVDDHLRIETAGETVFGVFSDFQIEFDGSGEDYGRLRFACTPHIVISARRHALRSVEETRQALGKGLKMPQSANLIEQIVDHFCDGAGHLITRLNDDLDHVEDHVMVDRVEDERRHLVPVRRNAVTLNRQISALLAVFRAWGARFRDKALKLETEALLQRLEGLARDVSSIQERSRLLQDEISAKLAEATNRSLSLISKMTAVMVPGTLITGLFGMNAGPVPFANTEGGFWWALALCVVATLAFLVFLRRKGVGAL